MKKAVYNIDKKRYQHTYNNHCNYRKIKPGIPLLYPDITRQAAQPIQFIMKKINNDARQYNENAGEHDPFTCRSVHETKIEFGQIPGHR